MGCSRPNGLISAIYWTSLVDGPRSGRKDRIPNRRDGMRSGRTDILTPRAPSSASGGTTPTEGNGGFMRRTGTITSRTGIINLLRLGTPPGAIYHLVGTQSVRLHCAPNAY